MKSQIITDAAFTPTAIRMACEAQSEIFVVQYLFLIDTIPSRPAHRIATAMMAAAERGVPVRILLNHFNHGRRGIYAIRPRAQELIHPNIDIRLHTRGQVIHSKIIITDAENVMIGSHNLTNWGLARSHNTSVLWVDKGMALDILSQLRPLFERAIHA